MGETGVVLWEDASDGEPSSELGASVKMGEASSDTATLLALLVVRILGDGRAASWASNSSSSNLVLASRPSSSDLCSSRRSYPRLD